MRIITIIVILSSIRNGAKCGHIFGSRSDCTLNGLIMSNHCGSRGNHTRKIARNSTRPEISDASCEIESKGSTCSSKIKHIQHVNAGIVPVRVSQS